MKLWTGLIALSLFFANPLAAAENPTKVAEVEGLTEYVYDNGLRLLLFPDNSKKTVTVNITYFVGSRHEGRGEKGMAHLLEHMLFKGTEKHKNIWKLIEDHGGSFNGTTWVDRTNYYETLPTTEPGNLEFALRMEADRMLNSLILEEDLQTEFTVVRNEFEMGENSPVGVLIRRMMSTAFLWHNYGDSTIGSKSDIERVPVKNLRAFYKKYYQPNNAMLVIAGDFQTQEAIDLTTKYFGSMERPEQPLEDTYTIEPTQDGARHVELRRVGDVAAAGAMYHICAGSHPDFAALEVLNQILTDQPSGRLYKELVETEMATSLIGMNMGLKEPGIAGYGARVRKDGNVDAVLEKVTSLIEGYGKTEFTEEEVNRAKNRILKNIELSLKNSGSIGIQLTEWAATGDWRLFFLHRDRIGEVTPADVQRVAAHYFKPSNRTSGVFYPTEKPDRTEIPPTPDVTAMVKNYKGREAISQGEEFEPTTENIEKRVVRTELSNGMQVALLQKETRGDAVRAVMTLRMGHEEGIKGRQVAAGLIPPMLMRGTKNHDYQAIKDRFDALKAQVNIGAGGGLGGGTPNQAQVSIQTDRKNFPEVVKFVGEILQQPAFPEKEFEIIRKQRLETMEDQLSNPQALAFSYMFRTLNPYPEDSIHYIPTMEESIARMKAVELSQLKDFYAANYGASAAQMTIVGDFDPRVTQRVLEETFGNWTAKIPYQRIERSTKLVQAEPKIILTPDKKMAIIGAATNLICKDSDADYAALTLANYIFGQSTKSRLLNRLRQKEGLSYGAFSFMNASAMDSVGLWGSGAICAPQNAGKAMNSLKDEWRLLVEEGIGAEELKDAQESHAKKMKSLLANDQGVASMLNSGLYVGRTMEYHQKLWDAIQALTPETINAAIQRHAKLDHLVQVQAGDLEKAAPVEASGTKNE